MLDGVARKAIDPFLDNIGKALAARGISANNVTIAGFVIGAVAAGAIATNHYLLGAILILVSRLCDGLDGVVARQTVASDFGGYLDIVLDFTFYGIIPLSFAFAAWEVNALSAAMLIFSFYVNGASFLAYAIMAEKHKEVSEARGKKSIFFTTGLAEATETLAIFIAACLWPTWFPVLAYGFAAVCIYTAAIRIIEAKTRFT